MNASIQVPEAVKQVSPVFVIAPTARNGITLIQRLLNSSRQIIVYGEDGELLEQMPLRILSKINHIMECGASRRLAREIFFTRTTEFWTSNLSPDDMQYLQVMLNNFFSFVLFYQQWSAGQGFRRWGIKQPLTSLLPLNLFREFLINARFLYVYRNLFDVARSAKARGWIKSPDDLVVLAQRWQDNLLPLLESPQEQVLVLRYEDLVADQETHIRKIEEFTGITNIDRNVMKRKINTFPGKIEKGESPNQYIEPEQLTDEESAVLYENAVKALEVTGYKDNRKQS